MAEDRHKLIANHLRRRAAEYLGGSAVDVEEVAGLYLAISNLVVSYHDEIAAKERVQELADKLLPFAETGARVRAPFNEQNDKRSKQATYEHAAWQKEAADIWSEPLHKDKSKSAVAGIIARRVGGKVNTIRRYIEKPGKAGRATKR